MYILTPKNNKYSKFIQNCNILFIHFLIDNKNIRVNIQKF